MSRYKLNSCCAFWVALVLLICSVGLLASLPLLLHLLVIPNVALHNGTETYKQFLQPTLPVRMQFWVLDIKNPEEVLQGEKPFLHEYGPFTYQEERVKFNLVFDKDRDVIIYQQNRTYHFLRNESIFEDSFQFTSINLPLLTLMSGVRFMGKPVDRIIDLLIHAYPTEKLLKKFTVRDLVWGYHDPILTLLHRLDPAIAYTDYVGILAGTNNTFDGTYEIVAGYKDPIHMGQILSFNDTNLLPFWSDHWTNTINGTDGTLAPPLLNKSAVLPSFISDICATVYGAYNDDTETHGITLWRFTAPQSEYDNATINPKNAGYCTPAGNCLPTGLKNLTECKTLDHFHIPVIISPPHFYACDPTIISSVDGLTPPNEELDRTWINIEPISGIVMQIQKRLQMNAFVEQIPGFSLLGNIRPLYMPMVWLNESVMINENLADKVKGMLLTPLLVAKICLIIGCFIGCGLLTFSLVLFAKQAGLLDCRRLGYQQIEGSVNSPNILS